MNLVTGATGILGSHVLLRLLEEGQPVIACRQKNSDLKKVEKLFTWYKKDELYKSIQWKELDINDLFSIEDALEGVHTVYHCAGFVSFNKKDREKLFKINDKGTANLVTACLEKKIDALCHVSSIGTINNSDARGPLHEDVFWKKKGNESDYALSKYNAEREVWRAMEEGLNALVVNPGVILSPGFWNQSSSRLFTTCYKGNLFYTSGQTAYIAARDVARAMVQLTRQRQFGNRYILTENNYSFKQVLDHVSTQLGKKKPMIKAGFYLLHAGRFFDYFFSKVTGREQVLTKFIIHSALNKQSYLNAKVCGKIDFKFTPVMDEITEICRLYSLDRPF